MTLGAARRLWIAPLLLVAVAACSTARPATSGGAGSPGADPSAEARRLVAHADGLAERGEARAARTAYEHLLRRYPGEPAAAAALYGIGRLQVDPSSGVRNYRAAQRTFSRLLADYPGSPWEAEARAWRTTIVDLLAREEEATRLKNQLEQLRRTDLDLERRR
ncbi:MAG TPA: tetratricopeptide repeat protein [Methylomirabilota bacterium]|nr:tetratricopeptide repeat protein [Methylomirabilota bacterium]